MYFKFNFYQENIENLIYWYQHIKIDILADTMGRAKEKYSIMKALISFSDGILLIKLKQHSFLK